ncbi:hypothetical protein [Thiorhodovibrio litoralis]|nr:hypothetical protein [Thiorhodovibrio litoralis]
MVNDVIGLVLLALAIKLVVKGHLDLAVFLEWWRISEHRGQ